MPRPKKSIEDKITEAGLFMLASKKRSLSIEEIEKYADKFSRNSWQKIFMNQEINVKIAKKYKDKVNFKLIHATQKDQIPFLSNQEIIDVLKDDLVWENIVNSLDINALDKFSSYIDMTKLNFIHILELNSDMLFFPNWFLKKYSYKIDRSFSSFISKNDFEEFENLIDFNSVNLFQLEEDEFERIYIKYNLSLGRFIQGRTKKFYSFTYNKKDLFKPLSEEFLLNHWAHYDSFNQILSEDLVWKLLEKVPNLEIPSVSKRNQPDKRDLIYSKELCNELIAISPKNLITLSRADLMPEDTFRKYLIDREVDVPNLSMNNRAFENLISENLRQKILNYPDIVEGLALKYTEHLDNNFWGTTASYGMFSEEFYFDHADKIKFLDINGNLNEWSQYEKMSDSLKLFLHASGNGYLIEKRKKWREYVRDDN